MKNEKQIQAHILKYLESCEDCWAVKTISANQRGVPDILGCIKGRMLALEVKADTGKPTRLQQYQIENIRQAGGIAAVVTNVTEVKELIGEYL